VERQGQTKKRRRTDEAAMQSLISTNHPAFGQELFCATAQQERLRAQKSSSRHQHKASTQLTSEAVGARQRRRWPGMARRGFLGGGPRGTLWMPMRRSSSPGPTMPSP